MQHTGNPERQQSAPEPTMARQLTCECGEVIRSETEDEVVELTLKHLRTDHPQLVGKMTRDDIVPLIEVVD
jgi:predicted small metal-binding protein